MIASTKNGIVNVCGEEYYRGNESEGIKVQRWKKRKYGENYHREGGIVR